MGIERIKFVHLHNHTEYSLLDGAIRLEELIQQALDLKMTAVAITDHGNLFAGASFMDLANKAGIQPILGCEVYVTSGNYKQKNAEKKKDAEGHYHLILLVENKQGYKNLIKLITEAYLEGFYYKPRIDKELLKKYSQGLIALSACLKGEIPNLILHNKIDQAQQCALQYKDIMGEGNFFLELQDHGLDEQKKVNKVLLDFSEKLSIPLVATNDCHYLKKSDSFAHDILLCIQTGKTVNMNDRMRFPNDQFYFKSAEEMQEIFADHPEALENTVRIAERCHFALDTTDYLLPHYHTPKDVSFYEYFEKIVSDGFSQRMQRLKQRAAEGQLKHSLQDYEARLNQELEMINKTGFAGYFLIVWDFIRFAREEGIPVGPGRGSGAGSLVAYAMKITNVDPLQYGLLFERFLNPERVSMPDFDIDFCMRRRSEVIDYVKEKYGRENVSQIITFGTMAARGAIRDVGRALGIAYGEVDKIAKMIPEELGVNIDKAVNTNPQLKKIEESNEQIAQLLTVARRLEGITRHASTHAAGVVIAPEPLTELLPLYRSSKDEITTQYAMNDLARIGLLKMDFLGLRTLTVIDDTLKLIKQTIGEELNLDTIPLDDSKTFSLFSKGKTSGIFQFESSGMRDILKKFQPKQLEDLIALNAIYRPGPIGSGMINDFITRKLGKTKVSYEVPELQDILKETYGVIVYQEQVMQIASRLAGFTMSEADLLRQAMGKKKRKVMKSMKEKFMKGALLRKIPKAKAEKIFKQMEYFAGYGFNKSHSAAYALLAYQTAYLKCNYPLQFMSALLTSEKENSDKLYRYIAGCKKMGIEILPPDINKSKADFYVDGNKIRFGLSAVKNVGEAAIDSILKARQKRGSYTSLIEFCEDVDSRVVNKRVIENLIKSGCFDCFGYNRAQLFSFTERAMEEAQRRWKKKVEKQVTMFEELIQDDKTEEEMIPPLEEWSDTKLLAYEKESLGFYITGHPLMNYEKELSQYSTATISELKNMNHTSNVSIGSVITVVKRITTKKGEPMAMITIEDLNDSAEAIVFPKVYSQCPFTIQRDEAVLIRGRVEHDEDGTRIIASEIIPLKEARERRAKKVVIEILIPAIEKDSIKKLYQLLKENSGTCPVQLYLIMPDNFRAIFEPEEEVKIKPSSQLTKKIEDLFGKGSIKYAAE
jgi:DNA polymerase-3 subunit alpha